MAALPHVHILPIADSLSKANQDSLCVHTHFGGDPEQAFFGVYDGHGEYGTQCSQFAKDKVKKGSALDWISGASRALLGSGWGRAGWQPHGLSLCSAL